MLARVVTLRFDPVLEAFDDGPLQEFLRAKEVLGIRDHFFVRNEMPFLAVVPTYNPLTAETEPAVSEKHKYRRLTFHCSTLCGTGGRSGPSVRVFHPT